MDDIGMTYSDEVMDQGEDQDIIAYENALFASLSTQCSQVQFGDSMLRPGMSVETTNGFMHITAIICDEVTHGYRLQGHELQRCKDLAGEFPPQRNELCWIIHLVAGEKQTPHEVNLKDVVRIRHVKFTNEKYNTGAWRMEDNMISKKDADAKGRLMVRYKKTIRWSSAREQRLRTDKFRQAAIEFLREEDLNQLGFECATTDAAKRQAWRGHTELKGSHVETSPDGTHRRSYNFFDAFCGAGGASRGAAMAGGIHIKGGFDRDDWAGRSYCLNFVNDSTMFYHMDATTLLAERMDIDIKADILHLSTPCPFFSTAHTVAGQNDEENFAITFACGQLLDRVKPRLGTSEQTDGITQPMFRPIFNALLHMFISRGYSVAWKQCKLPQWGLPQKRSRLLLIYAGPGERLPEFPAKTHSDDDDGLLPFTTLNSVFETIMPDHPLHNPTFVKHYDPPKQSYPGDKIHPNCITTNGGSSNYHPSGTRALTLAESAVAQGFPPSHLFSERNVLKQIGNAYPPSVACVFFRHLKRALQVADGVSDREDSVAVDESSVKSKSTEFVDLTDPVKKSEDGPICLDSDSEEEKHFMVTPTRKRRMPADVNTGSRKKVRTVIVID